MWRDWMRFFLSRPMLGLMVLASTSFVWQYFYLSTTREQFLWLGANSEQVEYYLTVLNICLPAVAIPATFLFSYINAKLVVSVVIVQAHTHDDISLNGSGIDV